MKLGLKPYILLSALWVLFSSETVKFSHLTIKDGLSQSSVKCMIQDSRGFIWIGTADGLNKFDGYQFEIKNNNPIISSSISGNDISCIYENPYDSTLWVGTQNAGLNLYNRKHDIFHAFLFNSKASDKIPSNFINSLLATDDKTLWIVTRLGGLCYFDKKDSSFTKTHFSKQDDFRTINCLVKDKSGNLWIGTPEGLYKWNYSDKQNKKIPIKVSYNKTQQNQNITSLQFDLKGNLWIGTRTDGLFKYHPISKNSIHFLPDKKSNSLSGRRINDILLRKNGELWIGTNTGLCKYLPKTKDFEVIKHNAKDPESLNNNVVYSILEDSSGIIWVGTYLGGINKLDPIQSRFPKFNNFNSLKGGQTSTNDIRSIYVDEFNTTWLGTTTGLIKIENLNPESSISDSNARLHFKNNQIGATTSFNDGMVISTINGIYIQDNQNKRTSLSDQIQLQINQSIQGFSSAITDDQNQVWFATGLGLLKYIPDQNKFELFNPKGPDGESMEFNPLTIKEDQTGKIWLGTFDGNLYSFDKYKDEFDLIISSDAGNELTSFSKIFSLCTSIPNEIWIGTNLGLYQFSAINGKIVRFLSSDGLSNNVVYAALADKFGNIWCSTNLGISKLNTKTMEFHNYTYKDGLQSNEFNQGAFFKGKTGEIYFGGINGLNVFDPEKITPNNFIPPVLITALEIQYNSITPLSNPKILDNHISETKELILNHKQNTFSFEFTSLSFSLPERNKYKYSFTNEGNTEQWIESGNRRFATFTNVHPGRYIFKVKGSNSDGVFNDEPAKINIYIRPPYWQTIWFRLILAVALLASIYFIIYFRIKNINRQKIILKKLIRKKTNTLIEQKKQIELQNNELKTFNENILINNKNIKQKNKLLSQQHTQISQQRDNLLKLAEKVEENNQTKFRFFTSISHELRTPLTLIISPLKELVGIKKTNEISRKLNNVYNNASKLLVIVNQLLDFRKAETDNMEPRVSKFELTHFVQKSAFLFKDLATQKKIDFNFSSDSSSLKIWADKDMLEKTMFNLLSNAFNATPNEGTISIHISELIEQNQKSALISIKDTGSGIEKDKIPFIFERFFQLDETTNVHHTGSGLGLALVKKYVDLHHGDISVKSAIGEGSEFTVQLPTGKNHFGNDVHFEDHDSENKEIFLASIGDYLPSSPQKLNSAVRTEKSTVLIVEDDKNLRAYLEEMLSDQFDICTADSAKLGLKLAQTKSPELIITDIMLPDYNGFLLCEKLKAEFKTSHVPVIILTSLVDNENKMKGIKAGADAYISKPFDLQYLLLVSEKLIEGRRALHKRFSLSDSNNIENAITNSSDQIFIKKAIHIIDDNMNNSNFNVEQFCSQLNLSQPQCYRKIKAITGFNISEFIRNTRLKKASILLKSGDYKINEIAYETGFNDPNYFTKSFTKLFGITPSEYAKM